jgi:hypothetical protein
MAWFYPKKNSTYIGTDNKSGRNLCLILDNSFINNEVTAIEKQISYIFGYDIISFELVIIRI